MINDGWDISLSHLRQPDAPRPLAVKTCSALCTLYADAERNALMTALQNAAKAYADGAPYTAEDMIYCYVEATPTTSLVSELVDELHHLGYRIKPNTQVTHGGAQPRHCV